MQENESNDTDDRVSKALKKPPNAIAFGGFLIDKITDRA